MIRVIAIDDHPLVLEFIQNQLQREADIELVGTETQGQRLLPLVRATRPGEISWDKVGAATHAAHVV